MSKEDLSNDVIKEINFQDSKTEQIYSLLSKVMELELNNAVKIKSLEIAIQSLWKATFKSIILLGVVVVLLAINNIFWR